MIPYLRKRLGVDGMKWWHPFVITVPIGLIMFGFLVLPNLYLRTNDSDRALVAERRDDVSNNAKQPVKADEPKKSLDKAITDGGSPSGLENLRKKHHLRPLTELEDGMAVDKVPYGIYGFSFCGALLRSEQHGVFSLEFHKHHDQMVYYVGYASEEHVGKYMAHQKKFTMQLFPHPWEGASSLIEIPIWFADCSIGLFRNGYRYDLLITDNPVLD
jgi:hypothetical protein